MKIRTSVSLSVVVVLMAFASGSPAAEAIRFHSVPGGKVRMEGTSTIHDWQVESPLIGGYLETGPEFPTEPGQAVKPGKLDVKAEVFIPVNSLKSIDKDGKPHSDRMNEIMYEKLKEPACPRILFRLSELAMKQAPASADAPYVLDAKGDLVVAGVTNRISMPVSVSPQANKKLKITGNTAVKMTDFGIQPPVLIGILSTGDEVKLSFEWIVAGKAAAPAK